MATTMPEKMKNALKLAAENRDRSTRLLSELVRIPSLTGEEGEAQKYLGELLKNVGAQVVMEEPDVEALFERFPHNAQYPTHWKHDLILPYEEDRKSVV